MLPVLLPLLASTALAGAEANVDPLRKAYCDGIRKVNEDHARKPGKNREADLAKKLPAQSRAALEKLLKAKDSPALFEALAGCGESALDLDLQEDFEKIRSRLEKSSPEQSRKLGTALSRPRYILRGLGGLEKRYLEAFAEVLEAVLAAYDELFGFEEWSKVPGKKLRVRIHFEETVKNPPHFAPQFPYHSEIDFPVQDKDAFRSPSRDGKFFFYGLCHELGHVIAMWGDRNRQEDHHSWAHYTGTLIVEHISEKLKDRAFLKDLADVRWRALSKERERLKDKAPSLSDEDGVLALFIALHDKVGSKAIGAALNFLDAQDRRLRINRVRYYTFKELKEGLLQTLKDPKARKAVDEIIRLDAASSKKDSPGKAAGKKKSSGKSG